MVQREANRAATAAAGSRGGRTVGRSAHASFLQLQRVLRLPIEADDPLVEAAATADIDGVVGATTSTAHAASLPLGVIAQIEHVADGAEPTVEREVARAFCATCVAHGIRAQDALNAQLWLEDETLVGKTAVRSKDGLPLGLFAPAAGILGRWRWVGEFLATCERRGFIFPDYHGSVVGDVWCRGTSAKCPDAAPPCHFQACGLSSS